MLLTARYGGFWAKSVIFLVMRKARFMKAYSGFKASKNILAVCLLAFSVQASAGIWDEGDIEAGQALSRVRMPQKKEDHTIIKQNAAENFFSQD